MPSLTAQRASIPRSARRLGAVLTVLSGGASEALGGKRFDFVVDLPILKRRDLTFHLAHLRFEIAEHLVELPGFGPGKEGHRHPRMAGLSVTASLRSLAGYMPV